MADCCASPRRNGGPPLAPRTPPARSTSSSELVAPPSQAGPEWQGWAEAQDWAAVIRWAVDAGHADVDEVELGMPALDMQLGYDTPTFFDMLGFHEFGMTDADTGELESRVGASLSVSRRPRF